MNDTFRIKPPNIDKEEEKKDNEYSIINQQTAVQNEPTNKNVHSNLLIFDKLVLIFVFFFNPCHDNSLTCPQIWEYVLSLFSFSCVQSLKLFVHSFSFIFICLQLRKFFVLWFRFFWVQMLEYLRPLIWIHQILCPIHKFPTPVDSGSSVWHLQTMLCHLRYTTRLG